MKQWTAIILTALLLVCATTPASAEDNERYQAIRLDENSVFIIDTEEGHLWLWGIGEGRGSDVHSILRYEGKLKPGRQMGDVLEMSSVRKKKLF
jgi:hypothetical protein